VSTTRRRKKKKKKKYQDRDWHHPDTKDNYR
jgi:hypothetical protein